MHRTLGLMIDHSADLIRISAKHFGQSVLNRGEREALARIRSRQAEAGQVGNPIRLQDTQLLGEVCAGAAAQVSYGPYRMVGTADAIEAPFAGRESTSGPDSLNADAAGSIASTLVSDQFNHVKHQCGFRVRKEDRVFASSAWSHLKSAYPGLYSDRKRARVHPLNQLEFG